MYNLLTMRNIDMTTITSIVALAVSLYCIVIFHF